MWQPARWAGMCLAVRRCIPQAQEGPCRAAASGRPTAARVGCKLKCLLSTEYGVRSTYYVGYAARNGMRTSICAWPCLAVPGSVQVAAACNRDRDGHAARQTPDGLDIDNGHGRRRQGQGWVLHQPQMARAVVLSTDVSRCEMRHWPVSVCSAPTRFPRACSRSPASGAGTTRDNAPWSRCSQVLHSSGWGPLHRKSSFAVDSCRDPRSVCPGAVLPPAIWASSVLAALGQSSCGLTAVTGRSHVHS